MSCIGKASHGGTSAGVSLKSSMTLTIAELHSLRCRFAELHSLRCETHVSQTITEQPRAPSLSAVWCVRMNLSQSCHHGEQIYIALFSFVNIALRCFRALALFNRCCAFRQASDMRVMLCVICCLKCILGQVDAILGL